MKNPYTEDFSHTNLWSTNSRIRKEIKRLNNKENKCRVIAVANQKGGVGKTVTCVNLGIGLAREGKKVLLIDADPQGSLTISLGYPEPDQMDYSLATAIMKIINEERRNMLVKYGVPNIAECNEKYGTSIHRIIVACDEIAEVLDKTGLDKDQKAIINQIEAKFSTIARLGRAFGIHLIFATQRPDADILKGQIKNNIGYRICGRADKILSQIILDNSEASDKISPNDQGMFLTNTGALIKAYYVEDDCLEGVDFDGEASD